MTDEISEFDLQAYADDQLDAGPRYAIETYLSQRPELAAQMMGEIGRGTALRLLAGPSAVAARTHDRPTRPWWQRLAPIGGVALAAAICAILLMPGRQPAYIYMAVASHEVAEMRAHMASQIETTTLNAHEILERTRIDLPPLPSSWQVTDVQLFPTDSGPAVLVAVRTGEGKQLSLFALRQRSSAPEIPDAIRDGRHSVAYWRRGDMSYALTGNEDARTLDGVAERLNEFWS